MALSNPLPSTTSSSHLQPSPMERGENGAHPSPEQRACQHKWWYFHTRCPWIQQTVRQSMTNFLAPEEVSCLMQSAPQWRCLSAGIHMKAYELSLQGSLAHLVVVHQCSNPGASYSATRRHGQAWPARQTGVFTSSSSGFLKYKRRFLTSTCQQRKFLLVSILLEGRNRAKEVQDEASRYCSHNGGCFLDPRSE